MFVVNGKKILQNELLPIDNFLKIYCHWVVKFNDQIDGYGVGKITYRALRYYATHKLMPKPFIKNRKAYYPNCPSLFLRLYTIQNLIRRGRLSVSLILKVLNAFPSNEKLKILLVYLFRPDFIGFVEALIQTQNYKVALKKMRWKESEDVLLLTKFLIGCEEDYIQDLSRRSFGDPELRGYCSDLLKQSIRNYKQLSDLLDATIQNRNALLSRLSIT